MPALLIGLWLGIAATILVTLVGFGVVYAAAIFLGAWLAFLIVAGALVLFAAHTHDKPPPLGF